MENKKNIKNKILVNSITALRLLATFAILPIYLNLGGVAAAIAIALFFLTDFIDGKLARKFHVQTFLGSILDSTSDKSLAIMSLLTLSTISKIYLIPLFVELGIFGVNLATFKFGGNVQSSFLGKVKTWFLGTGITMGFLASDPVKLNKIFEFLKDSTILGMFNSGAIMPSILGAATLMSYSFNCVKAYEAANNNKQFNIFHDQELQIKNNIDKIEQEKAKLLKEKENIQKLKNERKNVPEILNNLVDTEYYLENKDEPILKLFYKNH